jgi:pimeloyl-ACP methyl ester carboxylesterase
MRRPRRWQLDLRPVDAAEAIGWLIRRYLHSYGPATLQQFAQWLAGGRTWAAERFSALGDALEPVDVEGTRAWQLTGDGEDGKVAAATGVRLLPYFDAYAVGCHPREVVFPGVAGERALSGGQAGTLPVVLVDGALCYRAFGPAAPLAARLQDRFAVVTYDRRGRGESGDTAPHGVDREVEDLAVVIEAVGGEACVYGISSGGALVLEAAQAGLPIVKAAVYEIPFAVTPGSRTEPADYQATLTDLLAQGRNGAAVKLFMRMVGTPAAMVATMPLMRPVWRKLTAVAPTLPYDRALVTAHMTGAPLPPDCYDAATMPVLAMAGGKSPAWFRDGMQQVAERLPNATYRTIDGQTHMLKPDAIAPVLTEFFTAP